MIVVSNFRHPIFPVKIQLTAASANLANATQKKFYTKLINSLSARLELCIFPSATALARLTRAHVAK